MKFCIDIDDTILYSTIDKHNCWVVVDQNKELIEKIKKLYESGHTIILHTARDWSYLEMTIDQLVKYGVKYTTIVCGKPQADYYVDDKAIRPDEFCELEVD